MARRPVDLRLSHLRHFMLIVETRSYEVAARRAFRSQPAMSHSIRQLELRLGAPLFETSARTTLTPFGKSCLPLLRESLAHMERSIESAQQIAEVASGRVALAILPSVARRWLPPLLRQFNASHPQVDVTVLGEDSVQSQRLVVDGTVDFGITSSPPLDPKLSFRPLISDRFGLLCRRDHRYAMQKTVSWSRLNGEAIIGSTMHRMLSDTPVAGCVANPRIYVSNLSTLVALVRAGVGVVPLPSLANPVDDADLAFVPLVQPVANRVIGVVMQKDLTLAPAARAFLDVLEAGLALYNWAGEGGILVKR